MSSNPETNRRKKRRFFGLGLLGLGAATAIVSCASQPPRYRGPISSHFDGTAFYNAEPVVKEFGDFLRWQMDRDQGPWEFRANRVTARPEDRPLESGDVRVTFVNHATILIQTRGINILTDPIWSERASPWTWAGPKRFREPGLTMESLPPIHAVLVSHNHYDHMDLPTLTALAARDDPVMVVPLGNAHYVKASGASRIREMDWWERLDLGSSVEVVAVPSKHWSRRGLYDTNRVLWAGYLVRSASGNVYFAGDTGMGRHFTDIRHRLGPPDLALLPIGAYKPRWFMAPQHISPDEAVSAHEMLGASQSMAIHFGTFALGDDGQDEPVADLLQALGDGRISRDAFWIPEQGESRSFRFPSRASAQREALSGHMTSRDGAP